MHEIQTLDSIEPQIETLMRTNKNRSLSGIYKACRRLEKVSSSGNYLLLNKILKYGHSRNPQYNWSRKKIVRAVKISGFYQDEEKLHAYLPPEWEKFVKD